MTAEKRGESRGAPPTPLSPLPILRVSMGLSKIEAPRDSLVVPLEDGVRGACGQARHGHQAAVPCRSLSILEQDEEPRGS